MKSTIYTLFEQVRGSNRFVSCTGPGYTRRIIGIDTQVLLFLKLHVIDFLVYFWTNANVIMIRKIKILSLNFR